MIEIAVIKKTSFYPSFPFFLGTMLPIRGHPSRKKTQSEDQTKWQLYLAKKSTCLVIQMPLIFRGKKQTSRKYMLSFM